MNLSTLFRRQPPPDPEALANRAAVLATERYVAAQAAADQAAKAALREVQELARAQGLAGVPGQQLGGVGTGDPRVYARDHPWHWQNYQGTGYRPRQLVTLDVLREFAQKYDVLRSMINHLKNEVEAVPLVISARDKDDDSPATKKRILEVEDWFEVEGGLGGFGLTRSEFEKQVIEDLHVIGPASIYLQPTRGGGIYQALAIDAATIRPRVDIYGWPGPGENWYEQYVDGILQRGFTQEEMYWRGLYPRTDSPYPDSPTEYLVLTVLAGVSADTWNREWLTNGDEPGRWISLPPDMPIAEVRAYIELFHERNQGNTRDRQKVHFFPGGTTQPQQNSRRDQDFEAFQMSLQRRCCHDDQTDILTNQGWKRFADLDGTEEVATRSAAGFFQWQKPTAFIRKPWEGPMVHFASNTMDALVTPDHRMLAMHHPTLKGEFVLRPADTIVGKTGYYAPATSEWKGADRSEFILPEVGYKVTIRNDKGVAVQERIHPELRIPMEDWCAFLGIWLAEGSTYRPPGERSRGYRIVVSQTAESSCFKELKSLLERLPFNWRYHGHDFVCHDIRLHRYLAELGKCHEKRIPRPILELAPKYLEILFEWMMKGDGTVHESQIPNKKPTRLYVTNSRRLIDDVQELLQKIGLDGAIRLRCTAGTSRMHGEKEIIARRDCFAIGARTTPHRHLVGSWTTYQGEVFCVEVPNGTLYTRRNGRPLWSGNSAIMEVHLSAIGLSDGKEYATTQSQAMEQTSTIGTRKILRYLEILYGYILRRNGYRDLVARFQTSQEEDAGTKAERLSKACGVPWLTPNEAREEDGKRDSLGEEGDTLFVPVAFQPAELALNPPEPAMPGTAPGTESSGDKAAQQQRRALALWERKALRRAREGKPPASVFVHEALDDELNEKVFARLQEVETAEQVRSVFAQAVESLEDLFPPVYHTTAQGHERTLIGAKWAARRLAAEREA